MKIKKYTIFSSFMTIATFSSVVAQENNALQSLLQEYNSSSIKNRFPGAVYVMGNGESANTVISYGRKSDGTLTLLGSTATGGQGGIFDTGDGIDPLVSANAVEATANGRFVLAVDAGSSTLSSFRVNPNRSLTLVDRSFTYGIGPNSIAIRGRNVFVTNIDADGEFDNLLNQEGSLIGFRLTSRGKLIPNFRTYRELGNRPSHVRFSPSGRALAISSINAGSALLPSGNNDEIVLYRVFGSNISETPVAATSSTETGDAAEGRNLPNAIGFDIVRQGRSEYLVVTEARAFAPNGFPAPPEGAQTSSISAWRIGANLNLIPTDLDVLAGSTITDGQEATCWLAFSEDASILWASNTVSSTISTFSFNRGDLTLIEEVSAADEDSTVGFIDLDTSNGDGYLYQLIGGTGEVEVFDIGEDGLTPIQTVKDIVPELNSQGLIAF